MTHQRKIVCAGLVAACGTSALCVSGVAHAVQYGELRVSSNTTLHDDRYGNVVFDAPNVTLDCAGHQVHISSFTKGRGPNGEKVAIFADGRNGITIKNCNVIGAFNEGLWVLNSSNVTVDNIYVSVGAMNYPFIFDGNSFVAATNLTAYNGFVAATIVTDTSGSYSLVVPRGDEGIHIYNTQSTTILNTTITNNVGLAIAADSNQFLSLFQVDIEGNGDGFASDDDQYDMIENSTFVGNGWHGIALDSHTGTFLYENQAHDNAECDADEENSSGDLWSGNTFGTICGTVPASH